jgi:hypothetical protein
MFILMPGYAVLAPVSSGNVGATQEEPAFPARHSTYDLGQREREKDQEIGNMLFFAEGRSAISLHKRFVKQ